MKRCLNTDCLAIIKRFLDSLYNVCPNSMTLGNGAVISSSLKHKINVITSTETELVGVHIYMPRVMCTQYFIMFQDCSVDKNIIFQDNQSKMRLRTNSMLSNTKMAKNLKVGHLFMIDRIDMGKMLNKLRQEFAFRRDRAMQMNCCVTA